MVAANFENGALMIIGKETETATEEEKTVCKCLLKSNWQHLHPKKDPKHKKMAEDDDNEPSCEHTPSKIMKNQKQITAKCNHPMQCRASA